MVAAAMVARLLSLSLIFSAVAAYPEQGKYNGTASGITRLVEAGFSSYGFMKTMYKGTNVTANVACTVDLPSKVEVKLYLIRSSCFNVNFEQCTWQCLLDKKTALVQAGNAETAQGEAAKPEAAKPEAVKPEVAKPEAAKPEAARPEAAKPEAARPEAAKPEATKQEPTKAGAPNTEATAAGAAQPKTQQSKRNQEGAAARPAAAERQAAVTTQAPEELCCYDATQTAGKALEDPEVVVQIEIQLDCSRKGQIPIKTTAPSDGVYFVLLRAPTAAEKQDSFAVDFAEAKSGYGYLSAVDWPYYYFYMVMVIVYIFFQVAWLVMLACNWRDLLRVQYFIGAVILLGMIEKAVYLAEYENINKSGVSIQGAVIFAQIVSCLKRALSRVLIIVVCLGYGIVKPRLGSTLQKVLAAGLVYFVVAAIEGCLRVSRDGIDANGDLIAAIALVVVEVAICWWIFTSLVQTYRTLRLRRNLVKLSVYRHFANALIFSVLASLAFIGWFLYAVRFATCVSDLRELWLEEGFWQMLFTLLLLIVIILWRPSANNQRYAFAPLLDAGEEGEEDENYTVVMGETFTGTKQRPAQGSDTNKKGKDREYRAEDDLKWIEENIPTTALADKILTVDSDEERATARNEISKMD